MGLHNRCCIATSGGSYKCPKGHCGCTSTWTVVIVVYFISSMCFFGMSSLPQLLAADPAHSPGLDYSTYWSPEEVSSGVFDGRVSALAVMIYTIGVPLVMLGVSTCGAQAKDVALHTTVDAEGIPFRGWLPGIFLINYCWSGVVMFTLKYYTVQLRPIGLTKCGDVLEHHVKGFNRTLEYTASLAQLKQCRSFDPEYFLGFPSGHASMAFSGVFGTGLLFYVVPWVLDGFINAICCCDNTSYLTMHNYVKTGLRTVVLFIATMGASLIAASRVMDGSHFPVQVTAGSLLGVCAALLLVSSSLIRDSGPLGGSAMKKNDPTNRYGNKEVNVVEMA